MSPQEKDLGCAVGIFMLLSAVFLYSLGAFIQLDWDFRNWTQDAREVWAALIGLATAIWLVVFLAAE